MTAELNEFQFYLEKNLSELQCDLEVGVYRHGSYKKFIVCDNKRREISVSGIRDRVVHRLFYDYLVPIFDKTFIYDAWSCRKGKGLLGAIERAQEFMRKNPRAYVWRADIKKFFDSVDQEVLIKLIERRVSDPKALNLMREVIQSYPTPQRERAFIGMPVRSYLPDRALAAAGTKAGMPIGNLTSQIFANIYLNELDRFVKHELGVKYYLRYGDDFILVYKDLEKLKKFRELTIRFLVRKLKLSLNPKNDKILKTSYGLRFLGAVIRPEGRCLNRRNRKRIQRRVDLNNAGSYYGLVNKHQNKTNINEFIWQIYDLLNSGN